jgi:hypothetical protein
MKYLTNVQSLLFLLLFSLVFTACKDDKPKPTEKPAVVEKPTETPVELSAINTLRLSIAALHPEDQRAIIGSLPAHYTYALWKDRLSELMASAETTAESDLLSSVYNGLQLSMYTDDQVSSQTQLFVDNMRTSALEVYDNDTMHVLSMFTTLGESLESTGITEGGGAALPNCECMTYGLDFDCHIFDDCAAGGCVKVKRACGFWDIYDCNGLCVD